MLPAGLMDTLRALPRIDRRLTVTVAITTLVIGLAPVGYIVATQLLVDRLAGSTSVSSAVAVALVCGFFALTEILTPYFHAMAETFGYWINRALRLRLMDASMAPRGLRHVEASDAQDILARAVRIGSSGLTPGAAMAGIAILGRAYVQGIGCAVLLSTFRWWLGPLMLVLALVVSTLVLRDFSNATRVLTGQSPVLRRATYFRSVMTDPRLAGELRLLSLGDWVLGRLKDQWTSAMQSTWAARRPHVGKVAAGVVAVAAAVALVTLAMANEARDGRISLGAFVMYAQALLGFVPLFAVTLRHLNVTTGCAVMADVAAFEATASCGDLPRRGTSAPAASGDLVFDVVRFAYEPGADPVLRSVSFEVPFGSSVAIVGLNGAGKTTLIKLLARLYDPDHGRITWGGEDIASLDVDLWRRHLAVLFQDYLRLPFTAADNVWCGAPTRPLDADLLDRAANDGNASDVIDGLPHAWGTRLAKGYRDGVDLSGGQWQRLAAARAFYAVHNGARLLVLDEPSAALDIRAEARFFAQFHELRDLTRILISHRLAAVRHADRILLLDGGTIREHGTHESLLEEGGVYASLFRSQLERAVR